MQTVTKCFQSGWRLAGKKAGGASRFYKREAHRRRKAATREWLRRGRWYDEVLESRPITSWDVC